jgi:hypothetical protein
MKINFISKTLHIHTHKVVEKLTTGIATAAIVNDSYISNLRSL